MSVTVDQVRAEALFAGDLQPSQHPSPEWVRRSVTAMLRRYGVLWCAARMAQEFGDHPEAALARMAWALRVVQDCYAEAARGRARCVPIKVRWPTSPGPVQDEPIGLVRCRYPTGRYRRAVEMG